MKAEVRETGPLTREVGICLNATEVGEFIDGIVDSYRKRYAIPGFRPGKAPAEVVVGRFHEEIERAVRQELVPRTIEQALSEKKIQPAGPGRISKLRYEANQPLTFTVELEVWPEIDLKPYDGLEIDQLVEEVAGDDVEAYLGWMRERFAETEPVDRASKPGDVLEAELTTVDVEGRRMKRTGKEKISLEVGASNLLPEFREVSQGVAAGETRDLKVTYPDDFSSEELRGETRRYRMKVLKIAEKKLPAMDDDFARRLEPDLDLEGLRAKIRLRLESEKRLAARERLEQTLADRLIRENPFDLPPGSVGLALERLAQKQKDEGKEISAEQLEEMYRPHIERAHRRELILAKVAEREGVQVTPQDVEAEIQRMAQQEQRKVEEVRKDLGDLGRFRDFLFDRKVFDALRQKVKIREVRVPASAAGQAGGPGVPAGVSEKEQPDE